MSTPRLEVLTWHKHFFTIYFFLLLLPVECRRSKESVHRHSSVHFPSCLVQAYEKQKKVQESNSQLESKSEERERVERFKTRENSIVSKPINPFTSGICPNIVRLMCSRCSFNTFAMSSQERPVRAAVFPPQVRAKAATKPRRRAARQQRAPPLLLPPPAAACPASGCPRWPPRPSPPSSRNQWVCSATLQSLQSLCFCLCLTFRIE